MIFNIDMDIILVIRDMVDRTNYKALFLRAEEERKQVEEEQKQEALTNSEVARDVIFMVIKEKSLR